MNRFTTTFTKRSNRYDKEKYRYLVISKAQVKGISLASWREELREGIIRYHSSNLVFMDTAPGKETKNLYQSRGSAPI